MEIHTLSPRDVPERLLEIPEPPKELYARGVWPPAETKYLAVVGSRALSSYGKDACEKLIHGLQGYPITIVSGLALGADACAHKAALSAGLPTIAVLGSGVDDASIGPRAHLPLAQEILGSGGLILSENPPGYTPKPFDFPKRNRIVVGLSHAVLVVEAGEKSGTLITARLAGEYNRDLLCIPHRMGDPHSVASTTFLRIGATLVADPVHILEAFGFSPHEPIRSPDLEENEQLIFNLLVTPLSRTELVRLSRLSSSEVVTALVTLELKGILKEKYGAWQRV